MKRKKFTCLGYSKVSDIAATKKIRLKHPDAIEIWYPHLGLLEFYSADTDLIALKDRLIKHFKDMYLTAHVNINNGQLMAHVNGRYIWPLSGKLPKKISKYF